MKPIKVTINGKEVLTTEGKSILDVVHENKIDRIPTLCYDERIEPYGSCFLCVVEVERVNKLVPSCCTPVSEGMVIHTDNERIRGSRKTALELLLSNHYADCIGPCINNCPANVDAQGYIALISMGKHEEALKLIKQQNPLPLSIGRVCVRDCEVACRRQIIDESVAINHLKRYVADIDAQHHWVPELKTPNGKKVAVVGGGPSGLTCAYYLALEGYKVTIFEKFSRLGGMLMWGIPEYRLPKKILEQEIQWILDRGIDVKTGVTMGKDFDTRSLLNDGFSAVYLAVGAHKASTMRLEHEEDTEGIMGGIDFLRQIPDRVPRLKGTVIVVGGGNTAVDAARTALRCGAGKVKIVYRRSLNEMPAHPEEIHAAQAEGVEINFLTNPKAILRDENHKLKGIVCLEMKLEEVPGERPKPVPMEGSDFEMACDYLIGAIGQQVDTSFSKPVDSDATVKLERWGTVIVDNETMETSIPGVFAGGDAVTGPDTAIRAISHGKKAALAIHRYLRTGKVDRPLHPFFSFKHTFSEVTKAELSHFKELPRNKMPELPVSERISDFREVELGYTCRQSEAEPLRCLECGCSEYYDCELRRYADEFGVNISRYLGETRKYKVDTRHPLIVMDPNKCINCGRCVRTCSEILEVSALGFVYRGLKAVVKPAMEKPLAETNCVSCGNCVDTCPTGALTEKFPFKVLGTLPKENAETVCNFCSIGCKVNYKIINDDIFFVSNSTADIRQSHQSGYLCVRGRFGHRYLMEKDRLRKPLLKNRGNSAGVKEATWEEAVDYTAQKVKNIIDKHGPGAVAVMASPALTNEELYLLQKFARAGLKTNNIGSFSHIHPNPDPAGPDHIPGAPVSTAGMEDIRQADIVVVINGNLSEENLVMELKIKAAREKKGTRLILVNSSQVSLTKAADLWIDSRKGTNTILMNGVLRHLVKNGLVEEKQTQLTGYKELTAMVEKYTPEEVTAATDVMPEKYEILLNWLEKAEEKVVFIYNPDSTREKSAHDLEAIANFLLLTGRMNRPGSGILLLREYANSTGLMDMGVTPGYLPGYVKPSETAEVQRIGKAWKTELAEIFKPMDLEAKLLRGEIKALLVFGEDPLSHADNAKYFKGVEFLMVQDLFPTATTAAADVTIPAASIIEQEGTYTACDRRVQSLKRIFAPKNGKENWQFLQELANAFQLRLEYTSPSHIYQEIQEVNRYYGEKSRELIKETGKPGYFLYTAEIVTYPPDPPRVLHGEHYFDKLRSALKIFGV